MLSGFPCGSVSKETACNAGDLGSIPGSGRLPGEENGNPPQYSCLENPWTEEPGGLQSLGLQELDTTEPLNHCHHCFQELKVGLESVFVSHSVMSKSLQPDGL